MPSNLPELNVSPKAKISNCPKRFLFAKSAPCVPSTSKTFDFDEAYVKMYTPNPPVLLETTMLVSFFGGPWINSAILNPKP